MNFFIADVQTGFGTYVAFYLAQNGWSESDTGLALTVGGDLAGVLSQIPGGALCVALNWKRGLIAIGITASGAAALILAVSHSFVPILCAELLHGLTAGIITPAIGAISLGVVGRRAMSMRTGRNYRYATGGHANTAAMMGLAGAYYSPAAMFVSAGALCFPAPVALSFIRPDEIDYARARNAAKNQHTQKISRLLDLARNRPLILFAAAMTLFQLADASTLPPIGEHIATAPGRGSVSISILIIVPQIVVAIISPWIGYHSEKKGRRPLLLIGFAIEPVRAALLAFIAYFPFLLVAQLLNAVSGAIIDVLMGLVITDLTVGSGRFKSGSGRHRSHERKGGGRRVPCFQHTFFQGFGSWSGFIAIAAVAAAATALIWLFPFQDEARQLLG
jgi:predicted MFS family arabinose efflux permease